MDYVGLDWWPDKGVYEAYAFGRSGSTLIFPPLASKYQIRVLSAIRFRRLPYYLFARYFLFIFYICRIYKKVQRVKRMTSILKVVFKHLLWLVSIIRSL